MNLGKTKWSMLKGKEKERSVFEGEIEINRNHRKREPRTLKYSFDT